MSEISIHELELEYSELLPEREALSIVASVNAAEIVNIVAANTAAAAQTAAVNSANAAIANQAIVVN